MGCLGLATQAKLKLIYARPILLLIDWFIPPSRDLTRSGQSANTVRMLLWTVLKKSRFKVPSLRTKDKYQMIEHDLELSLILRDLANQK